MPTISINLTDQVTSDYATFYGYDPTSTVAVADFVTSKILDRIQNDVTELANRQAIAAVVPVADVTSDKSQTVLKESIATAMTAKLSEAPIETIKPVGLK